jgi:hypothetical protein
VQEDSLATEVAIQGQEKPAKIRHPVGVPALMLVTLGIYAIVWWYKVNREMRDLGRAYNAEGLGDSPGTSALAFFPGGLVIIPPFVSLYNGVMRAKRAQQLVKGEETINGWIIVAVLAGGFIIPFLGLVAYGYFQSEMNTVWERLQGGGQQLQQGAVAQPQAAPATEAQVPPPEPPPPPPPPPA